MTTRRFVHTVSPVEDGERFDVVVAAWLSHELRRPLSKSTVRKIVMAGVVRMNGRPVRRPGLALTADTVLDARIDPSKLPAAIADEEDADTMVTVLYEDEALIAVAKPAGLVMHATADSRRRDLFNLVRRFLAERAPDSGTRDRSSFDTLRTNGDRAGRPVPAEQLPYLGLHHRLDVETSGVVLFTKRQAANAALATQFERGDVTKVYHAITGRPRAPIAVDRRWRVENRLATTGSGRRARMQEVHEGGVRAATEFEVREKFRTALLVEARPRTGRKHQIRAHLSGLGMPILGDTRYDGPARVGGCAAPRVMLHAWRLSLRHPVSGEPLDLTCPYPSDFAALIECLRSV